MAWRSKRMVSRSPRGRAPKLEKPVENSEEMKKAMGDILGTQKQNGMFLRLKELGLTRTCPRCCGSGEYSSCEIYGTTCFQCHGEKSLMPTITPELLERAKEKVAAGGLDNYLLALEKKKMANNLAKNIPKMKFDNYYLMSEEAQPTIYAAVTKRAKLQDKAFKIVQRFENELRMPHETTIQLADELEKTIKDMKALDVIPQDVIDKEYAAGKEKIEKQAERRMAWEKRVKTEAGMQQHRWDAWRFKKNEADQFDMHYYENETKKIADALMDRQEKGLPIDIEVLKEIDATVMIDAPPYSHIDKKLKDLDQAHLQAILRDFEAGQKSYLDYIEYRKAQDEYLRRNRPAPNLY